MKIHAWLQFLKREPELRIEVVDSSAHHMTVAECRKQPRVIGMCRASLDTMPVKFMLRALENTNPINQAVRFGTAAPDRAALQAMTQGYMMCLSDFRSMGNTPEKAHRKVEATFEPTEKQ